MASGLLSLKWNNHHSSFINVLAAARMKESLCDATICCDDKFFQVHKLVLSTCSEYFEEIFRRTEGKHPVIVLKDIKFVDMETLLDYMYLGEVTVVQEDLPLLLKVAEWLKIKGLAVPDEPPDRLACKRTNPESHIISKRRKQEDHSATDRITHQTNKVLPKGLQTCLKSPSKVCIENIFPVEEPLEKTNLSANHCSPETSANKHFPKDIKAEPCSQSDNTCSTNEESHDPQIINLEKYEVKTEPTESFDEEELYESNNLSTFNEVGSESASIVSEMDSVFDLNSYSPNQSFPSSSNLHENVLLESLLTAKRKMSDDGSIACDIYGRHWPTRGDNRRRCRHCSTVRNIQKRTKFLCNDCNVPLCFFPCFQQFHRDQN